MTRLFRPRPPRLESWTPPSTETERPYSTVDADRDEARDAARFDVFGMRRVGGEWREDCDVPGRGEE